MEKIKGILSKIKLYVLGHKIISIILVLILVLGGYLGVKKIMGSSTSTTYTTQKAEIGTITSTITGSGQISSKNTIDIKAKVSDTVTYIGVSSGQQVKKGKLLFSVDSSSAQKSVRDAEINLENAKISLEKLKIQNSDKNINSELTQAYDSGFNTVTSAFLDLPGIMTGLNSMFFESNSSINQQWYISWYSQQVSANDYEQANSLKQIFSESYYKAKDAYKTAFDAYKSTPRTSDTQEIDALLEKSYEATKLMSDAIKNANNYLNFVNDSMQKYSYNIPNILNTHLSTLNSYTSKTNSNLNSLLSAQNTISEKEDAVPSASLEMQSALLSISQKENALKDAKETLSDYYVRAPFDGTIASVDAQIGDTSSGTLGTIITNTKMATITLNEVDVAKVELGQKVDLTFDAISKLTITGKVVEIDSVGTVSQGVVSYDIKISFDTDDTRIKPGMSVSATITTETRENVLLVPNGAIKKQGSSTYVETFESSSLSEVNENYIFTGTPNKKIIKTGLSNDTQTEIISGLEEGELVVTKTSTSSSSSSSKSSSTPSILNSIGGGGNRQSNTSSSKTTK